MASKITIAELLVEIGLDSKDAERAANRIAKDLKKVEDAGGKAGKGTDKAEASLKRLQKTSQRLGGVIRGLAAGMAVVGTTVAAIGRSVIRTGARFEQLRIRLKTVTGSAQAAEKAFNFVREFAKNTPFQVGEITDAFIKLSNFGLEPSRRALTSYGDTAAAMGKSLDQLVEAVADATVGEFERLKEFGVKANASGKDIEFTFRGVTTTVAKNSADIEEFLIGLGENNFAGAMADQMGTLNGIISNLQDAFTEFLLSVAAQGPLEEFKLLVTDIRDAAGDKDGLAKTLAKTLVRAIRALRRVLKGDFVEAFKSAAETLDFVIRNFDKLIALLAGAKTFQAFTSVAAGFSNMGIAAGAALGPIGAIAFALSALIPLAIDAGKAVGDALAPDVTTRVGRGAVGFLPGGPEGAELGAARQELFDAEQAVNEGGLVGGGLATVRLGLARERLNKAESAAAGASQANDMLARRRDAEERAEEKRGRTNLDALIAGKGKPKPPRRPRGRGGRRKKPEPESVVEADPAFTPPTTVSEFFSAAAAGELGPIAARTPSTADIEPTVAVDITNNNFAFDIKQAITGTGSPAELAGKVAQAIREEFKVRLGAAGQQLASNVVR